MFYVSSYKVLLVSSKIVDPARVARIAVYRALPLAALVIVGLLGAACGDASDLAEEISVTPVEELILTQEIHPEGWGLTECVLCHPLFKIHVKTYDPRVDLEKIRGVVDRLGEDSCVLCHGKNGT